MSRKKAVDPENSWEEQVETSIDAIRIGDKIRRLRLKRSMGLVELARLTGLSASFLSQLETGRCVPTLRNLSRISLVFSKDLNYFFEPQSTNTFRISRENTRTRLSVRHNNTGPMISESMGVIIPDRTIVPCIAEFEVSESDASFFPEIFDGEEFTYILAGSVLFHTEANQAVLGPQDCLWTHGGTRREYRCNAGETARAMIVTCPKPHGGRLLRGAYSRF